MKQQHLSILLVLSVTLAAALCVACQSDTAPYVLNAGDPIAFEASIHETDEVKTRVDESGSENGNGLDSAYVSETYNLDYYILLSCEKGNEVYTELGTYTIPSGFEGKLESKVGHAPLNWHDLTSPHTFYAWTAPWLTENKDSNTDTGTDNQEETNENWTIDSDTIGAVTIRFHNSAEGESYNEHKNNAILEKFIGAKSWEPYSYNDHGKYVGLTFYHLVSKIKIGNLKLIKSDNSIQEHLKANVTFIGMPTAATFYPHDGEGNRPHVGKPWEVTEDEGVTFFVDNDATTEDVFYVCPEIDFSKIDFKVKLNSEEYKDYDTYYGTFDDVEFVRKPGTAYDQGGDSKILHAGEVMTLNIVLIPGIGPGLSLVIKDWSTEDPKESPYHAYPGIYSDAEVRELSDFFANQKEYGSDNEEIERLFEMYGEERDIDGDGEKEKVFPLYDNVDISGSANGNIFPIPNGYILDGMGHTITLKSNWGNNNDFNQYSKYFNVGPVRDVYLTDGTDTIYIDKEGYVWTYDKDAGEYNRTNNKLEPLTGNMKSYDISIYGEVHQSTYYNGNIVGS